MEVWAGTDGTSVHWKCSAALWLSNSNGALVFELQHTRFLANRSYRRMYLASVLGLALQLASSGVRHSSSKGLATAASVLMGLSTANGRSHLVAVKNIATGEGQRMV